MRLKFQLPTFALLMLCTTFVLAVPQGPVIGKISLALGTVTGTDQDGDTFEVVRGADLFAGYSFETDARSLVRAELNDGTKLTISQNSSATLDEFSFEPDKGAGTFNTTVRKGGFNYVSGGLASLYGSSTAHSRISTPNGVIGVRGTTIEATRDEAGNLVLSVPNGAIDVVVTRPDGSVFTQSFGVGELNNIAQVSPTGDVIVLESVPAVLVEAVRALAVLVLAAEAEAAESSSSTGTQPQAEDEADVVVEVEITAAAAVPQAKASGGGDTVEEVIKFEQESISTSIRQ